MKRRLHPADRAALAWWVYVTFGLFVAVVFVRGCGVQP